MLNINVNVAKCIAFLHREKRFLYENYHEEKTTFNIKFDEVLSDAGVEHASVASVNVNVNHHQKSYHHEEEQKQKRIAKARRRLA